MNGSTHNKGVEEAGRWRESGGGGGGEGEGRREEGEREERGRREGEGTVRKGGVESTVATVVEVEWS